MFYGYINIIRISHGNVSTFSVHQLALYSGKKQARPKTWFEAFSQLRAYLSTLLEVSEHLVLGALVHPRHIEAKLLAQELFDEICFADSSSAIDGDEFGLVGIDAILYQLNFPFSSNDILLHIFFNFDFLQR